MRNGELLAAAIVAAGCVLPLAGGVHAQFAPSGGEQVVKPAPPVVIVLMPTDRRVSDQLSESIVALKAALRGDARLQVLAFSPDAPSFIVAARGAGLDLKKIANDPQRQALARALGANLWVRVGSDRQQSDAVDVAAFDALSGRALDTGAANSGGAFGLTIGRAADLVAGEAQPYEHAASTVSIPAAPPPPLPSPVAEPIAPASPLPVLLTPATVPIALPAPPLPTPVIVAPQPATTAPPAVRVVPLPAAPAAKPVASTPAVPHAVPVPTVPSVSLQSQTAPSIPNYAPLHTAAPSAPMPPPPVPVPAAASQTTSTPRTSPASLPPPAAAPAVAPPADAPMPVETDPGSADVTGKPPIQPPDISLPLLEPSIKPQMPLNSAAQSLVDAGDAAAAAGDTSKAIDDYRQAVDESPLNASPRVRLAKAYLAAGSSDLALGELQRAVAIEPQSAELKQYLQQTQQQHLLAGVDVLVLTVNAMSNPGDRSSAIALGDAYWNSSNLVLAEQSYASAAHAATSPEQAQAPYARLARLYAATQRYPECLRALDRSGPLGYSEMLRIIEQQSNTLMGSVDAALQQFASGSISRTQLYDQLRALDGQVAAYAGFLGKVTPPAAYKLSYLHRKLAANLMAQMTPNLLNYALTAQSSYLAQSQSLEHDATGELAQAQAIDQKNAEAGAP